MKTGFSDFGAVRLTKGSKFARVSIPVALAFLFALCFPHLTAASPADTSVSRDLPFAVADFDGDHQPDLATVQTGGTDAASSDYLVRFRLSTLGRRYVRVTAPKGGLLVEARDVNGDQLPDLVVASAWLNKPVAVLLNDGNGNFSQVDPSNYPEALRTSGPGWNNSLGQYSSALGLTQRSSAGDISLANCVEELDTPTGRLKACRFRGVSRSLSSRAPRAPPLAILL